MSDLEVYIVEPWSYLLLLVFCVGVYHILYEWLFPVLLHCVKKIHKWSNEL